MDSGELKEACVRLGARWRNLVNTIEPAVYGGDAAFLSNYFDHLVLLCMVHYCRNMFSVPCEYRKHMCGIFYTVQ